MSRSLSEWSCLHLLLYSFQQLQNEIQAHAKELDSELQAAEAELQKALEADDGEHHWSVRVLSPKDLRRPFS